MRQLPQDIEAEKSALGSILIDPSYMDDVRDAVSSAEDFYSTANATIYHAMNGLLEQNTDLDVVTLTGKLNDMGALAQVGGAGYLTELIQFVPGPSSAGVYASRVAEKALCRRLIEQQEIALESLYSGTTTASALIDSRVGQLIEMRPSDQKDAAKLDYWLKESMEDERPGINCGLHAVDDIIEGFEPGSYVVVGARPSMGKTAFGISVALEMSNAGHRVGFVSAEMSGKRVARRFVCAEAGISTKEFNRDKHNPDVQKVVARQGDLSLWVDQTPGAHIDRVCSRIRRWKREHDIEIAFVDYLQLLRTDNDNEYEGVTDASRKLNALKGELDITVVALAQLNRGNTMRQDKRPAMADLRGSGAVEQDADVILMLHRDAYYTDGQDILDGKVKDDEAQILVEKNRDGRTGTAHVGWIGKCGVFSSGRPAASATYGI
jgi:replicative DNA helicase